MFFIELHMQFLIILFILGCCMDNEILFMWKASCKYLCMMLCRGRFMFFYVRACVCNKCLCVCACTSVLLSVIDPHFFNFIFRCHQHFTEVMLITPLPPHHTPPPPPPPTPLNVKVTVK